MVETIHKYIICVIRIILCAMGETTKPHGGNHVQTHIIYMYNNIVYYRGNIHLYIAAWCEAFIHSRAAGAEEKF